MMQVVKEYSPKEYVTKNWDALMSDPMMRHILNSIRYNKLFTLNVHGPRGAGKSTAQRWINYLTHGDWELVMKYFRIQTKAEFERAVQFAKNNPAFWIPYRSISNLKRLWLADIDDKATLWPSSVGQTKEMSAWHVRNVTIRTDIATLVGSAPDTTDVRKRMRIGATGELLVVSIELPNGEEVPEGRYYKFNYHSAWHDEEKKFLSKTLLMRYRWPILPSEVLKLELHKRDELGNQMATKTQTFAQLEQKMEDAEKVLLDADIIIVEAVWEASKHGGFATSHDIGKYLKEKHNVERSQPYLSRTLDNLAQLNVIKHVSSQGGSRNQCTELGEMLVKNHKAKVETKKQVEADKAVIAQGKVGVADLIN
jgi:hypothetical protein